MGVEEIIQVSRVRREDQGWETPIFKRCIETVVEREEKSGKEEECLSDIVYRNHSPGEERGLIRREIYLSQMSQKDLENRS